jgi:hypothetical protein
VQRKQGIPENGQAEPPEAKPGQAYFIQCGFAEQVDE